MLCLREMRDNQLTYDANIAIEIYERILFGFSKKIIVFINNTQFQNILSSDWARDYFVIHNKCNSLKAPLS